MKLDSQLSGPGRHLGREAYQQLLGAPLQGLAGLGRIGSVGGLATASAVHHCVLNPQALDSQ